MRGGARFRASRPARARQRSASPRIPIRILLLERLDAVGAAPRDATLRGAALRAAGCTVRALVIGGERAAADPDPAGNAPGITHVPDDDACRDAVRGLLARFTPDLAILASAGRGAPGAWLPPGVRGTWWPTALLAPDDARARRDDAPALIPPEPAEVLDWSVVEAPRPGRAQLPLWDGDYVLAAGPLSGASGSEALEAFAALAGDDDGHELVVLGDPQPEFESRARALGIGSRVHFAGAARREAEQAWLRSAAALVIAGDAPLSAGLLLRALASRTPLLPVGAGGVPGAVSSWLARNGCAAAPAEATAGDRLEAVLRRSAATARAIERGALLAERHAPEALVRRVAAALGLHGRDAAAA